MMSRANAGVETEMTTSVKIAMNQVSHHTLEKIDF